MHINKINYSPSHTAIYRLHGKFDSNEFTYGVIAPYMITHHHGVTVHSGENPYSNTFYQMVDKFLQENKYSRDWLILNAQNNNLHEFAEELDKTVTTIITNDEDSIAINDFCNNKAKSIMSIKNKLRNMFGIRNEYQTKTAKTYMRLPEHLRAIYLKFASYMNLKEAYDEALKDRIIDVNSTKELFDIMMRETI